MFAAKRCFLCGLVMSEATLHKVLLIDASAMYEHFEAVRTSSVVATIQSISWPLEMKRWKSVEIRMAFGVVFHVV